MREGQKYERKAGRKRNGRKEEVKRKSGRQTRKNGRYKSKDCLSVG